jgi:hypothetical protein
VSWDQRFDDPLVVPGRKPLVTLRAAVLPPKAEHDAPEWQTAMEALLLVAERNGPTMLARTSAAIDAGTAQAGKSVPDRALGAARITRYS